MLRFYTAFCLMVYVFSPPTLADSNAPQADINVTSAGGTPVSAADNTQLAAGSPTDTMRFKRLLHGKVDTDEVINAIQVTKQDPQGFIWFGGEHGLARYDGHDIKIYQHDPSDPSSLTSNAIWDITFDHDGVMWLATDTGLGRYHPSSDDFTSYRAKGLHTNSLTGDSVRALAVDKNNNLLIGTDDGFNILDPSRKHYRNFTVQENDPFRLPGGRIRSVFADDNGDIWLGSTTAGLIRLQLKPFRLETFSHQSDDPTSIGHNTITDIIRDHTGALWVSTFGGGIARMDAKQGSFTNYKNNPDDPNSLGSNTVWGLFEDSYNNLWVATDHGGMALYDRTTDNFSHLRHNAYDPASLSSNNIRNIFEDAQGDLWIGAYPMGTNFFDRSSLVFENHTHIPGEPESLSHSTILSIEPSTQGHLWIGTEGGLNAFDPTTKTSRHYTAAPGELGALQFNAVLSLAEQSNGDLWVGTWSGGLHRLDASSQTFEHFSLTQEQIATRKAPNSPYIWSLLLDNQERYLWVGTETGGLNRYDLHNNAFDYFAAQTPADENHITNVHVWALLETYDGDIWAGTTHGLNQFHPETETFTHYFHNEEDSNSLGNNRVVALFEDSKNNIWIGTQGGGISMLDASRSHFKRIKVTDGLPSSNVASIIEDPQGFIWATTDKGAVRIDPTSGQIKRFQKSHGLVGNTFNRHNMHIADDGKLYLGAAEGLSIFQTGQRSAAQRAPGIRLTDFKIFNESVTSLTPESPLKKALHDTPKITLNYAQRVFSIDFSALSYRSSNRNLYSYQLEGFDKDWNKPSAKHSATYTNISPGNYTFRVKAANSDGIWNEQGIALEIRVLPPLWRTWWAYASYVLFLAALGWAYFRHKAKRLELQKERAVNAKLIKLDKMKDSFLANTSHELRTPLNGIIGLAESLKDSCSHDLDPARLRQLEMIVSSGRRLSHLINDILDLSKLAEQQIELKKTPVDLRYLTDTVITLLNPLVDQRPIKLQNEIPDNFFAVIADENRLQQVMFNLIGNGIKYSDRGYVKINAQQDDSTTTISVKDTGVGIAPDDLDSIFQSFCQLEHSDSREHGGTGLGLAITKQLIELHGGSIDVVSQPGKGTTFIFTMQTSRTLCRPNAEQQEEQEASTSLVTPINAAVQKNKNTTRKTTTPTPDNDNSSKVTGLENGQEESGNSGKKTNKKTDEKSQNKPAKPALRVTPLPGSENMTILSVDDDPINRMVLNGVLKLHNYKVLEADNGEAAIQKVKDHPEIDLVILDVMMPKMTGYEACEILREEHPIHDLPIIFLTAKDVESELTQGFLVGGNDFVSKPIKKEELLARIKAQLSVTLQIKKKRLEEASRDSQQTG